VDTALYGYEPNDPDDAMVLVAASLLEVPVLPGPIEQGRLEDLQALAFFYTLSQQGVSHPLGLMPGADPPDRVWHARGIEWGLELTVLTVTEVRADLARARMIGRRVREALTADLTRFQHLVGRLVTIAPSTMGLETLPRDQTSLVAEIVDRLAEDKGCFSEDVDFSDGFPAQFTSNRGMYGEVGPFTVRVQRNFVPDAMEVSASIGAQIKTSEAVSALAARVADKDMPANDLLLISCGLPDDKGYQTSLDQFMYGLLADAVHAAEKPVIPVPRHLSGVAIHLWPTTEWIEVYNNGTPMPWSS
jgi:hypothetical protein